MVYSSSVTNTSEAAGVNSSSYPAPTQPAVQPTIGVETAVTRSLSEIEKGRTVVIIGLQAEPQLNRRLRELGFRPGIMVRMGQHTVAGGRVVSIEGMRYALDNDTLSTVKVV